MKRIKSHGHVVDLLFTLALFLIFTTCSLIVVLIGANVYKQTISSMTRNYDMRTSLNYISQKVRMNDIKNGVHIDKLNNNNALVLEQNYNNKDYQTWIYYHDGSIKELFTRKGNEFSANDGREIMQVDSFNIEYNDLGIYTFTTTDKSGKTAKVNSFTRCNN